MRVLGYERTQTATDISPIIANGNLSFAAITFSVTLITHHFYEQKNYKTRKNT